MRENLGTQKVLYMESVTCLSLGILGLVVGHLAIVLGLAIEHLYMAQNFEDLLLMLLLHRILSKQYVLSE